MIERRRRTRNVSARCGNLPLGTSNIQIGSQTGAKTRTRQIHGILLGANIFLRDGQLALYPAKVDVVASHFGQQGNHRIAAGFDRGLLIGPCRFHGSAYAAEDVQFPRRVKTALIGADFASGKRGANAVRRAASDARAGGRCAADRGIGMVERSGGIVARAAAGKRAGLAARAPDGEIESLLA